jgi:hypothetical protein
MLASDDASCMVRAATPGDLSLVIATWQRCFGTAFWGDKRQRLGTFKRGHRLAIALAVNASRLLVACDPMAPHVLVGWACGGPRMLHYVYVKDEFRGDGVCRCLLDALGCADGDVTVTHWASAMDRWRKVRRVSFDPYALVFPYASEES